MHKLLERQLRKHFGSVEAAPISIKAWLEDVDAAYQASDQDRLLVERSLELASQELLQRNAALLESEERYRRIVETATEGICLLGPHNKTTFVNERLAEMLGYGVGELIGRSLFEFMVPTNPSRVEPDLEHIGTGEKQEHDVRLRRKDGSEVWAILSTSPILDRDGTYQGALGMITDITARKRAETELRNAYERLKELDQFRSQFINNAAHELGTPLTPIKLQVHLLRNAYAKNLDAKQEKGLEILDRNVDRLGQLVQDILDVAKIQSGRLNLKFQRSSLAPTVREASESFMASAVTRGITLESSCEPRMECHIDAGRLSQVLYNLLNNALKFTPSGGKIQVIGRQVGERAQVIVRDSGRGLDATAISKLFQPFSQVHDTMQVNAPGTGLGLFICRGIVEQMGGRIWCESPGLTKGASFYCEFPLAKTIARSGRASIQSPMPA